MTEAKFGEDLRYDPGIGIIGYLDRGIYHLNNRTRENLQVYSNKLLNRDLITEEEYETIMAIISRDFPTAYDYDVLYNIFREHRILRWSDKEVIKGYKILPEGIKMKLTDALKMKAHVKIDIITNLNGKFIEMTNFFFLVVKKMDGKDYLINFHKEYDQDYLLHRSETELPKEIEKLFFSKYYFNPFKGLKRLWALSRHYKDFSMINKLKDFISGNISLLYQLKSELGNMMLLIEKLKSYPKEGINNQIQDIKSRLVYVLEVGDDELTIDQWFNNATTINDKYDKYEALNKIKKYMEVNINYFTLEYLEHIGLTHLRYPYVPREQTYNTNKMLNSDAMIKFEKEEEEIRKLEKRNRKNRLQEEIRKQQKFEREFEKSYEKDFKKKINEQKPNVRPNIQNNKDFKREFEEELRREIERELQDDLDIEFEQKPLSIKEKHFINELPEELEFRDSEEDTEEYDPLISNFDAQLDMLNKNINKLHKNKSKLYSLYRVYWNRDKADDLIDKYLISLEKKYNEYKNLEEIDENDLTKIKATNKGIMKILNDIQIGSGSLENSQEILIGSGCLTCPKGKYRQNLLRRIKGGEITKENANKITKQQYDSNKKIYNDLLKQYNKLYDKQNETNYKQIDPELRKIENQMQEIDRNILLPYQFYN